MRTSPFIFAAVASASASALFRRQTTGLPECAVACVDTVDSGECSRTDDDCLCRNEQFIASAAACIQGACAGPDLAGALTAFQSRCGETGATVPPIEPSTPPVLGPTAGAGTSADPTGASDAPDSAPSPRPISPSGSPTPSGSAISASLTGSLLPSSSASGTSGNTNNTNSATSYGANALTGLAAIGLVAMVL